MLTNIIMFFQQPNLQKKDESWQLAAKFYS